ncbi:CDC45 family [Lipomyces japonicus]|uniref:CDC45 family n=1 Tax=Lipomyces japonicus TaxID=56871 RepID=UPI0034CD615C
MFVPPASYVDAFKQLRKAALSHTTCRLVLFVACMDVDAICAAKILVGILKRDLIPHRVCSVSGYSELRDRYDELEDEISSVVLLGCGALVNLEEYFEINNMDNNNYDDHNNTNNNHDDNEFGQVEQEIESKPKRRIYVFDSHRPWNLHNLFGEQNVVTCFDEGEVHDGTFNAERDALVALADLEIDQSDEDDEDSDSDSDSDSGSESDVSNDGEGNNASGQYIEEEREVMDDFSDQEELDTQPVMDRKESDFGSPHSSQSGKRKSPSSPRSPSPSPRRAKSIKEIRRNYQSVIAAYYNRGATYSSPISSQLYTLLSFLGDAGTPDLWLSVVGTTALDHLAPQMYRKLFPLLRDEVRRLNPPPPPGLRSSADDTALIVHSDFRVFLLRHWSLYESFLHSTYVASRLQLWTEDGRKKLHKMLAKMGISLHAAKEQWTHADVTMKRELSQRLSSVAGLYGIDNVIRSGVMRKFGFRGQVTAGDAVEAVTALLECGVGKTITEKENVDPSISKDDVEDRSEEQYRSQLIENFWTAWDALDDIEVLLQGINRAQLIQRAIVRAGTAILEKRSVVVLRTFRLAVVRDGPDLELFRNPITLTRLASWVSECATEMDGRELPVVMAALDVRRDTYRVVGLPRRTMNKSAEQAINNEVENSEVDEGEEETSSNAFGMAFQQVARQTQARVKIDSFESSVVDIRKDDLTGFLEGLTSIGIA